MKLIANLRENAKRRAAFNRTVRELRALPEAVAHDLDIDRANASDLARKAVYGA